MEKGTNHDAVPPRGATYSTFAAAKNGARRPGAAARDGESRAGRAAGDGRPAGGMERARRSQPGV